MANEILTIEKYATNIASNAMAIITEKQNKGLVLPQGYQVQNAFTLAIFQIKETLDKDKVPVLKSCSQDSIQEALITMATKGLDPNKKHCYWIAYGNRLTCMESYMGIKFRAKRADPNIKDVFSEVVYEKDTFKYQIKHGTKIITEHLQEAENIDITKIKGAYCTILYNDGTETSEYMTIQQIRTSWLRGNSKGTGQTHIEQPDMMAMRTVTRRLCTATVNNDTNVPLLNDMSAEDFDDNADKEEATEMLDITPIEPVVEPQKTLPPKGKAQTKVAAEPEPEIDLDDMPDCLR